MDLWNDIVMQLFSRRMLYAHTQPNGAKMGPSTYGLIFFNKHVLFLMTSVISLYFKHTNTNHNTNQTFNSLIIYSHSFLKRILMEIMIKLQITHERKSK